MKILKIKINNQIIEEKVIEEKDGIIKTKHHVVKISGGFLSSDEDGFQGACIITRGAIKNLFKKIGV